MGWDTETGVPSKETFEKLGLDDYLEDLAQLN
jgi:aldehyde:ferredoxin oxidoreductase